MANISSDTPETIAGRKAPDDPNAWIRERREEFLSEPYWKGGDVEQLAYMIDNVGLPLRPTEISDQIDPYAYNIVTTFKRFRERLNRHEALGPIGKSGRGLKLRYWLGELVVVEGAELDEAAIGQIAEAEAVAVDPAEVAKELSRTEVEKLIEGMVLGGVVGEDIFKVLPERYFETQGRAIISGLQSAMYSDKYTGNSTAADNFRRIKAVLDRYNWGAKTR